MQRTSWSLNHRRSRFSTARIRAASSRAEKRTEANGLAKEPPHLPWSSKCFEYSTSR
jgi:hypothetical protein